MENLKQFFVRTALKIVRILVRVKPIILGAFRRSFSPFRPAGRFFVSYLIVPVYRLFYHLRRNTEKAWHPAKNRFMMVVTNRYMVHVSVAMVAIFVGVLNLQTNEVRAETFGEKSLMYRLVTEQDNEIIEEYATDTSRLEFTSVSYRDSLALRSMSRGIDLIGSNDTIVQLIDGGALSALTVSDSAESIAPREGSEVYLAKTGDTLSTIASDFGISTNTLLWANDKNVRSVVRPGDEFVILPVSGVNHKVKIGDTLSKIAKKYDAEETEILAYNKLASANDLVIGESLMVPGGEIQYIAPVVARPALPSFSSPTSTIPTSTSNAAPTTIGSGRMAWPTDLRTITQYFGWRHTGIDIDCYFDNDNYAADDGIVSYAGWKGGYGYAVDINHGNGITTRYAHHASLYVTAGQQVSKGQALGRCGTTGRSTGTHVHFEVIVNGKFRNPLEYIR